MTETSHKPADLNRRAKSIVDAATTKRPIEEREDEREKEPAAK